MAVSRNEYFHYYADLRVEGNMPPQAVNGGSALTSEIVCDVVADALSAVGMEAVGLVTEGQPNSDSAISTVYPLRDQSGQRFIVRAQLPFLPDGDTYDYTDAERRARNVCRSVGIRVPTVYASHDDIGPHCPFTFTLEENSGRDGWRWLADHPESAADFVEYVAGCLATMHSITIDGEGYGFFDADAAKRGTLKGGGPENYRAHINTSLPRALGRLGVHKLLTDDEAAGLTEFFRTSQCIGDIGRQSIVLLHGDPGYHNTLVDDSGMPSTLIDFGESQAGPAVRDLAAAFRPLAFLPATRDMWLPFLEAYQAKGGVLPDDAETMVRALILRIDIAQLAAGASVLDYLEPPTRELTEKNLLETRRRIVADASLLNIRHFE